MNFITSNPRILVDDLSFDDKKTNGLDLDLDAVFIPFKARFKNVMELLKELHWYQGPIFLFPSTPDDISFVKKEIDLSKYFLLVQNENFCNFFNELLTSQDEYSSHRNSWDLPLKRNFILLFARQNGFKKILLIDDDIRGLAKNKLMIGVNLLYKYSIAGCFIENFPDTSILGHILIGNGKDVRTFLSGSMLIVKTFEVKGFFPKIYNEDWLFMVPHILNHSVCAFGTCEQVFKNPFSDPTCAHLQEFGEIIAEVLYSLIENNNYDNRYNFDVWEKAINERFLILNDLKNYPIYVEQKVIIDSAIDAIKQINPKTCISFIKDWEVDIYKWQNYLKENT